VPLASLKDTISCLRDGAPDPEMWVEVLPLAAKALGGTGASCFACNDHTGGVEWAYMSGPLSNCTSEYVEHYAPLDLYRPALSSAISPGWLTLTECLSESVLGRSEWYQDFIRHNGLTDAVAVEAYHDGERRVIFGVHYETRRPPPAARDGRMLRLLTNLQEAAQIGQLQRTLKIKASLGRWVLDHLGDALFVASSSGRVVEMNAAAETILSSGQALTLKHGKLVATDAVEARQLDAMVERAGHARVSDKSARRLMVGRDHHHRYLVTVFPLTTNAISKDDAMVVIRVVDLSDHLSPDADLPDLFGLSRAEERLARELTQGKTLQQLTTEFGVQMPTLRAQMRSVLRKCGVKRQVDLMRVLLKVC
jgi:DNA-binding CsgD family transcriptional regulator